MSDTLRPWCLQVELADRNGLVALRAAPAPELLRSGGGAMVADAGGASADALAARVDSSMHIAETGARHLSVLRCQMPRWDVVRLIRGRLCANLAKGLSPLPGIVACDRGLWAADQSTEL